jgi:hypothetical protein
MVMLELTSRTELMNFDKALLILTLSSISLQRFFDDSLSEFGMLLSLL